MNKEVFSHKHIVLCEDHYNPLGIIRSLGEEGIKPIVLLYDSHLQLVQQSKYIGELHIFKSIEEAYKYLMEHYGNETKKPFLYNGSDVSTLFIDNHYNELKDHFFFTNGQGGIEKYLQKSDIAQLASECGCKIPKEELLNVGELPSTLKYPVITKAVTSAGSSDWKSQSFVCENEEQLKEAYHKIEAKTILVQEYIRKKDELCINGISINAGEQVFMPYVCNYYRMPPGKLGNFMYFTPFKDKELTEKLVRIFRRAKYSGIFDLEFLLGEEDELYFLEVNFRNSAWSYAITYGGFNLPLRWAISTLDNKLYLDDFKYKEKYDVMAEIGELHDCLQIYHISLLRWFMDFLKVDCSLIYNRKDPKPFRKYLTNSIKRFMKIGGRSK